MYTSTYSTCVHKLLRKQRLFRKKSPCSLFSPAEMNPLAIALAIFPDPRNPIEDSLAAIVVHYVSMYVLLNYWTMSTASLSELFCCAHRVQRMRSNNTAPPFSACAVNTFENIPSPAGAIFPRRKSVLFGQLVIKEDTR